MKRYFLFVTFILGLFSCTNDEQSQSGDKSEAFTWNDSTEDRSCPFITQNTRGDVVLGWVKEVNDTTAFMCYAVSADNGKTFGKPVEISGSGNVHPHGENLPKIIFKPGGEIIAMWGASNPVPQSKYSGLVYYSQSFDGGESWTNPAALVKDTSAYDQRYFDMAILPSGEAMVIWLDNRGKKDKEGSTLFCAVTEGKNGFMKEKAIGETCCPCCRTDLYVDKSGYIHASYRDIINDSIRDMVHLVSVDGGKSFSPPVRISNDNWVISGCPHTGPTITDNAKGLHFAWYTMGGGEGVFYCYSEDGGKTFSKRDTVSAKASAKHPQITALPGGNIVIAWDESVKRKDKTGVRIGLQVRDPHGKILSSEFIGGAEEISEFPFIRTVDDKQVLIAYSTRKGDRKGIVCKTISLH